MTGSRQRLLLFCQDGLGMPGLFPAWITYRLALRLRKTLLSISLWTICFGSSCSGTIVSERIPRRICGPAVKVIKRATREFETRFGIPPSGMPREFPDLMIRLGILGGFVARAGRFLEMRLALQIQLRVRESIMHCAQRSCLPNATSPALH